MPGFEAIVVWAWVNFYNIGQIRLIAISSFDYNLMHDLYNSFRSKMCEVIPCSALTMRVVQDLCKDWNILTLYFPFFRQCDLIK